VEADRRKWDFHPALAGDGQGGHGRFYDASPTEDFPGMVRQMKDYVKTRGQWVDANLLDDPQVPATPSATYAAAEAVKRPITKRLPIPSCREAVAGSPFEPPVAYPLT
jgi:hypothetical protein